jgi:hypothetical protein
MIFQREALDLQYPTEGVEAYLLDRRSRCSSFVP